MGEEVKSEHTWKDLIGEMGKKKKRIKKKERVSIFDDANVDFQEREREREREMAEKENDGLIHKGGCWGRFL